jgi:hypothetical protein
LQQQQQQQQRQRFNTVRYIEGELSDQHLLFENHFSIHSFQRQEKREIPIDEAACPVAVLRLLTVDYGVVQVRSVCERVNHECLSRNSAPTVREIFAGAAATYVVIDRFISEAMEMLTSAFPVHALITLRSHSYALPPPPHPVAAAAAAAAAPAAAAAVRLGNQPELFADGVFDMLDEQQ